MHWAVQAGHVVRPAARAGGQPDGDHAVWLDKVVRCGCAGRCAARRTEALLAQHLRGAPHALPSLGLREWCVDWMPAHGSKIWYCWNLLCYICMASGMCGAMTRISVLYNTVSLVNSVVYASEVFESA